jgi:hypothetical protein
MLKSKDVYKTLGKELAPWSKSQGFARTKALLGWHRPHDEHFFVFWCQCESWGWLPHRGGRFTVEFQYSREPIVGTGPSIRRRFAGLMDRDQLDQVLLVQNGIIQAIPPPDEAQVREWGNHADFFLKQLEPINTPYENDDDIWLRYYVPQDVEQWGKFILAALPSWLDRFADFAAAKRKATRV